MNMSNHAKGAHGYGAMFSGDNASYHHILIAHHSSRYPRISDLPGPGTQGAYDYTGYFDVRNNVYYNWVKPDRAVMAENMELSILLTAITKQDRLPEQTIVRRVLSSDPTARAYINGNYVLANTGVTTDNWTEGVWSQFDSSWVQFLQKGEKQAMKMAVPNLTAN